MVHLSGVFDPTHGLSTVTSLFFGVSWFKVKLDVEFFGKTRVACYEENGSTNVYISLCYRSILLLGFKWVSGKKHCRYIGFRYVISVMTSTASLRVGITL